MTTIPSDNRSGQLFATSVFIAAALLLGFTLAPYVGQFIINHFFIQPARTK